MVIPSPFTNESRLFLYNLVDLNQFISLSELLEKVKVLKSRKGKAGIMGTIAAIKPKTSEINPNKM